MTFGVTDQGFSAKRLADIRDDLEALLIQIEDPDTGETLQVDFDEDDPFIQVINTLIANNASTWEALQAVYNQFNPRLATGAALSGLVQINALTRRPGTPATSPITLTGSSGTLVPAGTQFQDNNGVIYALDADVTIGASPTSGTVSSVVNGAFNSLAGTITTIVNPIAGLDSVTNANDSTPGTARETDEELRLRRDLSTETPSVAPVEAIFGAVNQIEGVQFVRVFINNTLSVDARGIPAKSVAAVIQGGDDQTIAETLFLRSPAGVGYFGNTTLQLTDLQGEPYDIAWIRPALIDIEVEVDVEIIDANTFPSDGADRITQAIIDYAAGGADQVGVVSGFDLEGFVPGEDVVQSRLFTPVNSVPGHKVTRLEIAEVGGTLGTADVPINFDEISNFLSANITVNVT